MLPNARDRPLLLQHSKHANVVCMMACNPVWGEWAPADGSANSHIRAAQVASLHIHSSITRHAAINLSSSTSPEAVAAEMTPGTPDKICTQASICQRPPLFTPVSAPAEPLNPAPRAMTASTHAHRARVYNGMCLLEVSHTSLVPLAWITTARQASHMQTRGREDVSAIIQGRYGAGRARRAASIAREFSAANNKASAAHMQK